MPNPSVLNENEPSKACSARPSPLRNMIAPCGTGAFALRTSTAFSIQAAQRPESQRANRRLRAAPIHIGPQKFKLGIVRWQDQPCARKSPQIPGKLTECEERQRSRSEIDAMASAEPGSDDIDYAIGSAIGNDFHCSPANHGLGVLIPVLSNPPRIGVAIAN